MFNFSYILHFSSCGYYCLKHINKRINVKRKGYMSLFEIKEVFLSNNYYCYCLKIDGLEGVKQVFITLVKYKSSMHYIVVKKYNNNYVWIYDPLFLFVRRVKRRRFVEKWTKICYNI